MSPQILWSFVLADFEASGQESELKLAGVMKNCWKTASSGKRIHAIRSWADVFVGTGTTGERWNIHSVRKTAK